MRHSITFIAAIVCLCISGNAEAQKPVSGGRRSTQKTRTSDHRSKSGDLQSANFNSREPADVGIPQENSLKSRNRKTKKVVIVPAPPPPPGNDPIPPKRIP